MNANVSRALVRLGLLDPLVDSGQRAPHRAVRTAGWFWRNALLAATALIGFAFVAQIFIGEFFNYHPVVGWFNQPLVQLPWLRYIPGHLAP